MPEVTLPAPRGGVRPLRGSVATTEQRIRGYSTSPYQPAEAINSRIQELIQQSCGYRNRERFKHDMFFHLGGLDLYPGQ